MKPTIFAISNWQASEQTAGYWLISLTISSSSLFDVGTSFWLDANSDSNSEPLRLFDQALHSHHLKLKLLSRSPIAQTNSPTQLYCLPPKTPSTIPATGNLLILGSDLEMANLFYIAKQRFSSNATSQILALLHSKQGFPFVVKPARFMLPELPAEAIGASALLEDWKIGNRLASELGLAGCFEGSLADLLDQWIQYDNRQTECKPEHWQVIACLPNEMQKKCLAICQSIEWLNFTGIRDSL